MRLSTVIDQRRTAFFPHNNISLKNYIYYIYDELKLSMGLNLSVVTAKILTECQMVYKFSH